MSSELLLSELSVLTSQTSYVPAGGAQSEQLQRYSVCEVGETNGTHRNQY